MGTYLYEQLSPDDFQHLCAAIVSAQYPQAQCFPVGHRDGGRDISSRGPEGITIYQVKFFRHPEEEMNPVSAILQVVKSELDKIRRLAKVGAARYVLMTNMRGTAVPGTGRIDAVQESLSEYLPNSACMWRDDLDRFLDHHPQIKYSYPIILRLTDVLPQVLAGLTEDRMSRSLRAYIKLHWGKEGELKFRQADLNVNIFDLFIDVPCKIEYGVREYQDILRLPDFVLDRDESMPPYHDKMYAAKILLDPEFAKEHQFSVLEGAPGQGKSTITQYICQIYRSDLLGAHDGARIPFRLDLRHMGDWVKQAKQANGDPVVESYLAHHLSINSGMNEISNSDINLILGTRPVLVVFDGLDEVADLALRADMISLIHEMCLRYKGDNVQVVVTTRPAAFATAPRIPNYFVKIRLCSLARHDVLNYARRWALAKREDPAEIEAELVRRLELSHIAVLSQNTMQATILLTLIFKLGGAALPEQRTELYRRYIEHFFDRESEKSEFVRSFRGKVLDLHGYLAWKLLTDAEGRRGSGSGMTEVALRSNIERFLIAEQHSYIDSNDLFDGTVQRVFFLVSREEGRYEFDVKPLLEYFVAVHLYQNASYSPLGRECSGDKVDLLNAMLPNRDWMNILRFFVGNFSKGELPAIVYAIEEMFAEASVLGTTEYLQTVAGFFLSDGVFSQSQQLQGRLLGRTAVPGMLYRVYGSGPGTEGVRLSVGSGRESLVNACVERIRREPSSLSEAEYLDEACGVLRYQLSTPELEDIVKRDGGSLSARQRASICCRLGVKISSQDFSDCSEDLGIINMAIDGRCTPDVWTEELRNAILSESRMCGVLRYKDAADLGTEERRFRAHSETMMAYASVGLIMGRYGYRVYGLSADGVRAWLNQVSEMSGIADGGVCATLSDLLDDVTFAKVAAYVERLEDVYGRTRVSVSWAISGGQFAEKTDSAGPLDVSEGCSFLRVAAYAKTHARVYRWWDKQLRVASEATGSLRWNASLLILCMASDGWISRNASPIQAALDRFGPDEWMSLCRAYFDCAHRPRRLGILSNQVSGRLALVLFAGEEVPLLQWLVDGKVQFDDLTWRGVRDVFRRAMAALGSGNHDDDEILNVIKSCRERTGDGSLIAYHWERFSRGGLSDLRQLRKVTTLTEDNRLPAWLAARLRERAYGSNRAKGVSDIARDQNWPVWQKIKNWS